MAIRRFLAAVAASFAWAAGAAPGDLGVVLLHGKQGSPQTVIHELAAALKTAGYKVSTPEGAWSRARIYAGSVADALAEIDGEVERLRGEGARRIVIAGQSLGANVAIRYALDRARVDGVIALAPAHNPDSATARRLFGSDLLRARKLIADGKGDEKDRFSDADAARTFPVVVTPRQYVSWWGEEDGELLMPRNIARLPPSVPVLFVVGTRDSLTRPRAEVFDKAPPHPRSAYVSVDASHTEVPSAATTKVLEWLAGLDS